MDGGEAPRIDIRVIRIRRPETIADLRIKLLIKGAVNATRYPGTTPQRFYEEIAENIAGDTLGVFVGFDNCSLMRVSDMMPRAVAIVNLPISETMWAPVARLAYSENRELSEMIGARVREWVKQHGHDTILAMNLYHDDEAFCRVFRHVGEPLVIGSVVEVRL